MMQCVAMGHSIVALANLTPINEGESDSYMYQTVGSEAIKMYSEAMQLPLFQRKISGYSKLTTMTYKEDSEDEVEDLYLLLKDIQSEVDFSAVSCGAILSDYQRIRVENVCSRLNICSLSYLWRRDEKELLKEMIDNHVDAVLIKTAALGLKPKVHLGKSIKEMQDHLLMLNSKYGSHVCGEGGEYETFTLDCPLFRKKIVIDESRMVYHTDDDVAPVAYLHLTSLHLDEKSNEQFNFDQLVPNMDPYKHLKYSKDTFFHQEFADWNAHINFESETNLGECWINGDSLSVSNLKCFCCENPFPDEVKSCTKNTLLRLVEILNSNGHGVDDVVYLHLFVSNMSLFSQINEVYKTFFDVNPPARVCISLDLQPDESSRDDKLPLLQIDCLSFHDSQGLSRKKVMHVQGISHWAAANIGPYSQCVRHHGLFFLAGQIGLVPGTMQLINGGIVPEAQLSMRHVHAVLSAMDAKTSIVDTVQGVCYLTESEDISVAHSVWKDSVDGDQEVLKNLIYVVVPSLPRKASIEWQIIASQNTPSECGCVRSCIFSSSDEKELDPFQVARCLMKKLEKYVENLDLKQQSVLQIKLFVMKKNLKHSHLQGLQKELSSQFSDVLPAANVIPVKKIYTNDCQMQKMTLVSLVKIDHTDQAE
ncbi:unnamed protein product [Clavelina lepadiformis]|uniref:Diphthine--ammonia ligase n=1 Tax=Clavelina lepadiformis TaxID=159417 RepID=A0ABP0FGT6_CLALP